MPPVAPLSVGNVESLMRRADPEKFHPEICDVDIQGMDNCIGMGVVELKKALGEALKGINESDSASKNPEDDQYNGVIVSFCAKIGDAVRLRLIMDGVGRKLIRKKQPIIDRDVRVRGIDMALNELQKLSGDDKKDKKLKRVGDDDQSKEAMENKRNQLNELKEGVIQKRLVSEVSQEEIVDVEREMREFANQHILPLLGELNDSRSNVTTLSNRAASTPASDDQGDIPRFAAE